jgi:hypothetical protein
MQLNEIFEKPVNRPIEGVIKADDEASLLLEVEEYVLTNEAAKRLESFLDAYTKYQGANGVWVSGFFGSGKSHLLKILALLLENRSINGTTALDLFLPKCKDNEILRGDLKRAVAIPSKSILFNIDQKAEIISKTQIDALLSVFVKVFDEMCGYYGKQAYIAKFERDLDGRGQYIPFREAYQNVSGQTWERGREVALLEAKNIAQAYALATGAEVTAAQGILDRYRSDYKLSIEDFANQINGYIEQQKPNFRLNFFVDEVGQYIADNTKLMTNLQTVAESLETKCRGRAWIIVTAQEDMNAVVGEMNKQQGNDFSKIQARFANRMKLTSANVDEVIQKRLLLKNESGVALLTDIYHEQTNNFRTLFDFADGSQTYRNFKDRDHFIHAYPFIPYQFTLFQAAIQTLSQHNAFEGKHSSVGERSMLGVFQQVAVHIARHEIRKLATFDLMFEGIPTALKAQIQRSVLVAESNLGDAFAVRLLKALFLVKYVKEFKATVRNLSILMLDNFDCNVTELQKRVAAALDLLEQQTYIQRNGDLYELLTDEEKDVEQEIKNTDVENSEINKILEEIIFDHVLKQRKIRYEDNGQDYPFSRRLDGSLCGREYELAINVITPLNELIDNETTLSMQSMGKAELLVIMPADNRFFQDLLLYKKTDSYIRINMTQTQQEIIKRILTDKSVQNRERRSELQAKAKELLGRAKLIINLKPMEIGTSDAQTRIQQGFYDLIRRTYPNLSMLRGIKYSENDIATYLKPSGATLFSDDEKMMSEAEQEVLSYIQGNTRIDLRTTMKGLVEWFEKKPYGWYLAAIQCITAKLCAREKIEIRQDSNVLEGPALEKALRNTHGFGNSIIDPQLDFTASQVRNLKDFYEHFFDTPAKANEAKPLARETQEAFKNTLVKLEGLLSQKGQYPFLAVLVEPIRKLQDLSKKEYGFYLTELAKLHDDLETTKEEIFDPLLTFMSGSGRTIFDDSKRFLEQQHANFSEIEGDQSQQARDILADPRCFAGRKMLELKKLVDALAASIEKLLAEIRQEGREGAESMKKELISMDDFNLLTEGQKGELLQSFSEFDRRIQQQKIVAVVRENIRHFKETEFVNILNKQSGWVAAARKAADPPPHPGKSTGGSTSTQPYPDPGDDDKRTGSGASTREPEFISKSSIKISFPGNVLASESDLDDYLKAIKTAFLAEIHQGKRVRL